LATDGRIELLAHPGRFQRHPTLEFSSFKARTTPTSARLKAGAPHDARLPFALND